MSGQVPDLRGTARLNASPAAVRDLLQDPERMGSALPNVDWVDLGEDGAFSAVLRPRLGIGPVPFRTRWTPTAREDHRRLGWTVAGENGEYELQLKIELELAAAGAGTELSWSTTLRARGTLRSVGQRTLQMVLVTQIEQVLAAVDAGAAEVGASA